jgi:hypothetical protein
LTAERNSELLVDERRPENLLAGTHPYACSLRAR